MHKQSLSGLANPYCGGSYLSIGKDSSKRMSPFQEKFRYPANKMLVELVKESG